MYSNEYNTKCKEYDICFITHNYDGSIIRYIYDLIKLNKQYIILLIRKDWTETYYYEKYNNGKISQERIKKNLEFDIIKKSRIVHINSFLTYNKNDINILLNMENICKIITIHNLEFFCKNKYDNDVIIDSKILNLWYDIIKNVNKAICVSNFVYDIVNNNTPKEYLKKIEIISNPDIIINRDSIDSNIKHHWGIEKEQFRIACIGSLNKSKGLDILIEIQKMAKIDKSPIEFFVFGDGPYLPSSGRYTTLTLNKLILEYKPHLLFFPSVINKSYSYTFSIALASKIPILSTHKGIFIEKSELSSDAYTYEILDNIDASKWYEKLMELYEYFVETDKIITFNEIDYRISPNKINEIYSNEISREI